MIHMVGKRQSLHTLRMIRCVSMIACGFCDADTHTHMQPATTIMYSDRVVFGFCCRSYRTFSPVTGHVSYQNDYNIVRMRLRWYRELNRNQNQCGFRIDPSLLRHSYECSCVCVCSHHWVGVTLSIYRAMRYYTLFLSTRLCREWNWRGNPYILPIIIHSYLSPKRFRFGIAMKSKRKTPSPDQKLLWRMFSFYFC